MSKTLVSEEHKAQPKWQGITSLVFGLISMISAVKIVYWESLVYHYNWLLTIINFLVESSWIFGATAVILGIIGFKFRTWPLSIVGILAAVYGFILYIYLYNQTHVMNVW